MCRHISTVITAIPCMLLATAQMATMYLDMNWGKLMNQERVRFAINKVQFHGQGQRGWTNSQLLWVSCNFTLWKINSEAITKQDVLWKKFSRHEIDLACNNGIIYVYVLLCIYHVCMCILGYTYVFIIIIHLS